MLKAYRKLNIYYKCSVLSGLLLCLISLGLIPLYFIGYKDIPLGFILGFIYAIGIDLLFGIFEKKRGDYYKWAVVISIFRYFLFAALLVLVGLCYYKWDIKIFNIFSVTGGYLLSQLVFIILFIKERKDNGSI
ncbi:MAG: hypothetical protein K5906_01290 [Bacilli bacterium]|nr:hypothetical protein [Bacilli bacterium]